MARVEKPWDFGSGEGLFAHKFTDNFDILYDEMDGNIDNTNLSSSAAISGSKFLDGSITGSKLLAFQISDSLMDYTSVNAVRCGPNAYASGPNGVRKVTGYSQFTLGAAETSHPFFINFASDCNEGNPRFLVPPRIFFTSVETIAGYGWAGGFTVIARAVRATGINAVVICTSQGTDTEIRIDWKAIGGI